MDLNIGYTSAQIIKLVSFLGRLATLQVTPNHPDCWRNGDVTRFGL